MTRPYGSNRPPSLGVNGLVAGIAFSTSLLGAVIAGSAHPVAGLGVLAVSLVSALGIHHLLWLAEEHEAAEMAPQPRVDVETVGLTKTRIYSVKTA